MEDVVVVDKEVMAAAEDVAMDTPAQAAQPRRACAAIWDQTCLIAARKVRLI